MIQWCNSNQGFLMVILTGIYVIATVIICIYNHKAISTQKDICKDQNQITLFSLRYEVFREIQDEFHVWRFSNNDQVLDFLGYNNASEVLLKLASHCQNIYYLSEKTSIIFDSEISQRLDQAWRIIRNDIYPQIKRVISCTSPDVKAIDILIIIKQEMNKAPLQQSKDKLFYLEAEITALIEQKIKINHY